MIKRSIVTSKNVKRHFLDLTSGHVFTIDKKHKIFREERNFNKRFCSICIVFITFS